jgi:hypothetical protein
VLREAVPDYVLSGHQLQGDVLDVEVGAGAPEMDLAAADLLVGQRGGKGAC